MRCGRANSQTLLSGHGVVVGLRCGKASTKPPRYFETLDPVFPRDSSGRSILFPIKEVSETSATSSPFSKRSNGKKPSRVGRNLLPTRAQLMKTPTGSAGPDPSSSSLTHVHQVASIPVEQVEELTLRDGPRPPARSGGRHSGKSTNESHFSSSRSRLEPPAPFGTVRAASSNFSPNGRRGHRAGNLGSGLAS